MPSEMSVRCFVAAGQYRSFTKAADALYLSRQAVSRQIAILEDELHAKLFERTTAHVRLTDIGEMYFDYFVDAAQRWEKLCQQVQLAQEAQANTIRIGCLHEADLGRTVLAAVDARRKQGYSIQVDWDRREPHELLELLMARKLDIVLSFERSLIEFSNPDAVEHFKLHTAQALLLINRNYPLLRENSQALDFVGESCFISEHMNSTGPQDLVFRDEWTYAGLRFRDVRVVSNRETLQSMVEMGRGVTICTDIDRFSQRPDIIGYPTGTKINILCGWRRDERRAQVLGLLQELRKLAD